MKIRSLAGLVAFFIIINAGLCSASYTLKDVIQAAPQIAQHKPSALIAPVSGQFIHLKGEWYQIRLFSFEGKTGLSEQPTFHDFIKQHQQEAILPKAGPETLFPTDYFAATPLMKEQGFNYLLSLRRVEDPSLVRKLNSSHTSK